MKEKLVLSVLVDNESGVLATGGQPVLPPCI